MAPLRPYGFALPRTVRHRVWLGGLRRRLRVVHLTDLHFGAVTPLALQVAAVEAANAEEPDAVLLTGDYVARGRGHLGAMRTVLARLEAPTWAVLGNHDHYVGARAVRRALEDAGIAVLDNRWTRLGRGEEAVLLVGVDDLGTGHADPGAATRGLPRLPAIGLSHHPSGAPALWRRGVPLVLAGHTHGGQFHHHRWTPGFYARVARIPYLSGWYREPEGAVYVNPGVGSSVVPWRWGRPAMRTVAVIELLPAAEPR